MTTRGHTSGSAQALGCWHRLPAATNPTLHEQPAYPTRHAVGGHLGRSWGSLTCGLAKVTTRGRTSGSAQALGKLLRQRVPATPTQRLLLVGPIRLVQAEERRLSSQQRIGGIHAPAERAWASATTRARTSSSGRGLGRRSLPQGPATPAPQPLLAAPIRPALYARIGDSRAPGKRCTASRTTRGRTSSNGLASESCYLLWGPATPAPQPLLGAPIRREQPPVSRSGRSRVLKCSTARAPTHGRRSRTAHKYVIAHCAQAPATPDRPQQRGGPTRLG